MCCSVATMCSVATPWDHQQGTQIGAFNRRRDTGTVTACPGHRDLNRDIWLFKGRGNCAAGVKPLSRWAARRLESPSPREPSDTTLTEPGPRGRARGRRDGICPTPRSLHFVAVCVKRPTQLDNDVNSIAHSHAVHATGDASRMSLPLQCRSGPGSKIPA